MRRDPVGRPPEWLARLKVWGMFRYEPNAARPDKPTKVPWYVDAGIRKDTLDTPEDKAKHRTYDEAMAVWRDTLQGQSFHGLCVFLGPVPEHPGLVLQGLDFDGVEANGLSALANEAPGYMELSPSGRGSHVLGLGQPFDNLNSNGSGIEAYCGQRFFTWTGQCIRTAGNPEPVDLRTFVLASLVEPWKAGAKASASPSDREGVVETVDPATVTKLRSALTIIPADDRQTWVSVGIALKTLGRVGWELWVTWSQSCPEQWDKGGWVEAEERWRTFHPNRTGWQAVFTRAQDLGWVNPDSKAARVIPPAAAPGAAQAEVPGPAPAPEILQSVSIADVIANPSPPPVYLIQDWMPAREVTLLPADGGTGKSILTLQAAVSLAMGRPFMGKLVTRCRVLFFSAEDDENILRHRLRRICEHESVDPVELAKWLCVVDATENPCLFSEDYSPEEGAYARATRNLTRVENTMRAMQGGDQTMRVTLVVDNASDTYDANENVRQYVRSFVRGLKWLAKQLHGSVLLLAHLDKVSVRGGGGTAQYSGSTAWHNAVRSRLLLEPARDADGGQVPDRLMLYQRKNNHGPKAAPVHLEWSPEGVLMLVRGESENEDAPPPLTQVELRQYVLDMIDSDYQKGMYIGTSLAPNATKGVWTALNGNPRYPRDQLSKKRLLVMVKQLQRAGLLREETYPHPTRRGHIEARWQVVQQERAE